MNGDDLTRELQNTFPLAPELAKDAPDVIALIAKALAGINENRDVSLLTKELSAFRHMREKL
jgi:hypothetical protein